MVDHGPKVKPPNTEYITKTQCVGIEQYSDGLPYASLGSRVFSNFALLFLFLLLPVHILYSYQLHSEFTDGQVLD